MISNMTYGTSYTVTSENATCTTVSSSSFSIDEMLPTPATPVISEVAATCLADGTATVSNYDGALTYTFTPAGPTVGAGGVISNMTYGTSYTVTSENATCTTVSSSSFSIDEMLPTPATPTASVTAQPTCAIPTGTITVSGVNAGSTYSVNGPVSITNATGVFTGLVSGTYDVTETNAAGCISGATSLTVDPVPGAPAAPVASATIQPTCAVPTGTIEVTAPTRRYLRV